MWTIYPSLRQYEVSSEGKTFCASLPISGILFDDAGRISLRISCNTVTASRTVTLKLSFSPPLSEIRKEAKSKDKKKRTGSKKLTT